MSRKYDYKIGKRSLASLAALYLGACGPGVSTETDSGVDPCTGGKTDVVCQDNRAPTLEGFLDDVSGDSLEETVERRKDRENGYPVSASDADGDSLEFSYRCLDASGNITFDSGWSNNSEFKYNFNGNPGDEYTIEAKVRDSKGLESSVKSVKVRLVDNEAPYLKLKITQDRVNDWQVGEDAIEVPPIGQNEEGRDIYEIRGSEIREICFDPAGSFDRDGDIVKYILMFNEDNPASEWFRRDNKPNCIGNDFSMLRQDRFVKSYFKIKDNEVKNTIYKFLQRLFYN